MRRASWESRALAGGSVLLGCLLGLGAARADTRPSYVGAGACFLEGVAICRAGLGGRER